LPVLSKGRNKNPCVQRLRATSLFGVIMAAGGRCERPWKSSRQAACALLGTASEASGLSGTTRKWRPAFLWRCVRSRLSQLLLLLVVVAPLRKLPACRARLGSGAQHFCGGVYGRGCPNCCCCWSWWHRCGSFRLVGHDSEVAPSIFVKVCTVAVVPIVVVVVVVVGGGGVGFGNLVSRVRVVRLPPPFPAPAN